MRFDDPDHSVRSQRRDDHRRSPTDGAPIDATSIGPAATESAPSWLSSDRRTQTSTRWADSWIDDGRDVQSAGSRMAAQLRRWVELRPIEFVGLSALLAAASLLTAGVMLGGAARPTPTAADSVAAANMRVSAAGTHDAMPAGRDHSATSEFNVSAQPQAHDVSRRVTIHVAGAVVAPGVVTLVDGSRVVDAIAIAGGAHDDADLHSINLARLVDDGEHLYVPRVGEESPPTPSRQRQDGRVDLNRAGVEQLQQLPGVGPSRAEAIVRHREQHGPFRVPGDIRNVSGIGEATFQNMADRLMVR